MVSISIRTLNINGEQAIYLGPAALVAAKSAPGCWYVVEDGRCTCPGFEHRGHCRHLAIAAEAERWDRETATPVAAAPVPPGHGTRSSPSACAAAAGKSSGGASAAPPASEHPHEKGAGGHPPAPERTPSMAAETKTFPATIARVNAHGFQTRERTVGSGTRRQKGTSQARTGQSAPCRV